MEEYFRNSFVSLQYDKEASLGKAVWSGSLQGEELREAYLLTVELIDRYSLTRWLSDDRQMKPITPADLQWSLDVHVPRMANSSLLRMARIPSIYEDNNKAVDAMVSKGHTLDLHLTFRHFDTEEEAMNWLMEEPF
ncbi:hypothetical protein ACXYMU_11215 [Pontibacter sp. CAU 1760]